MRLLLDQGVPRTAAALLRDASLDAVHVGESGASRASDACILEMARSDGRIVVTIDADFHALLALAGATSPAVIRVRIEGLRAREFAELVLRVLAMVGDELKHGAAVTVTAEKVRVRRLPLIR